MFSALSPAMASVLFADRPDIMARVLGVPTHAAPAGDAAGYGDVCQMHGPAGAAATLYRTSNGHPIPQEDDVSEHAAHGIFCSFCLAAMSMVTVPVPPVHAFLWASAVVVIATVSVRPPAANLRLTRHPRDPPPVVALS